MHLFNMNYMLMLCNVRFKKTQIFHFPTLCECGISAYSNNSILFSNKRKQTKKQPQYKFVYKDKKKRVLMLSVCNLLWLIYNLQELLVSKKNIIDVAY